jgi:phospho-N-acetylmuramoyl-pentapeptide-transferase
MLYHIAQWLQSKYSWLNIFHYVSVRSMASFLSTLSFSFLLGEWFLRLSGKNFRSKVRKWTPEIHKKKNNTPTMGGIFILITFSLSVFLWINFTNKLVWIFLFCIVGFASIGFLDDWYKIKHSRGVSARCKFLFQIGWALTTSFLWYFLCSPSTKLCVPFFKNISPDLGFLIIPWATFIIVGTSNAVNLTDGLDGLATIPLVFNFAAFSCITYLAGHKEFAQYLLIPYAKSAEVTVLTAGLIGGLLGFLWYNAYPAQIFMGDVGSLMLGAGLALVALFSKQELLLPLCGGIFVLETMSVIIQIFSRRFFNRKVFKMAPIHHHFECKGWQETKITIRFWIISIILAVLTLLVMKIR